MRFSYYWPAEKQKVWQWRRMRDYLRRYIFPYHPYHRKQYRALGITAGGVNTYNDFRRLPTVTKQNLIEDHLAFVLQPAFPGRTPLYDTAPIRKIDLLKYAARGLIAPNNAAMEGNMGTLRARIETAARLEWFPMHFHASGGTTGNPSPALYSHRDVFHTTLKLAPMTNWGGIKLEDKGMNLFPAAPHLAFFQVVFNQFLLGANVFHTCGGSVIPTERQIELCERMGSDYVVAIPSYLTYWLETAVKMREQGRIKKIGAIRYAVVAAEPMVPAYRERLRGLFAAVGSENVKILEGYGMTELKGAFYECAEGSGMHLSPESHLWEVLDPETKEPVPEGSEGVLTFSHIDFRGTVFMRYYTGDLIRGLVWDKCPHCGRTGPRLLTPMCRAVKDFTKIKGSRVNLLDLQTAIRTTTGVLSFQVVITKDNPDDPFSRDLVRVHVAAEEGADREALTRDIKKNVKLDCEISPNEIVFNSMEEIEAKLFSRTNLKADWVVDERPVHL